MKAFRRAVFAVVIGALVAAVPVSAIASERILRGDVRQAEAQFEQSLDQALRDGLDRSPADQLLQRYRQVAAIKAQSWWQVPVVEQNQLGKIAQLQTDLEARYQQQIGASRDSFKTQLQRWGQTLADAQNAGMSSAGAEETEARLTASAALATTPNELVELDKVMQEQYAMLDSRLTAFRTARDGSNAALQNARTLLATAGQYRQLNIAAFQTQITSAAASLSTVHDAAEFAPVTGSIQQVTSAVQSLLDARTAAYNQLADTRSTLATAQSIGASVGDAGASINALAGQLGAAPDQATFEALTARLSQQKQALANAIWTKQQQPVAFNAGAGKVIVISLSRQLLTAYQDGKPVLTSYVATGRPALPTPRGTYHIFYKQTPYTMISPWPYGSPYWYPTSRVNWVMEFLGGGYFIHDAPWRSWYGPGANLYNGTHGCVNVPYSAMQFLFSWASIGTTVVVQ